MQFMENEIIEYTNFICSSFLGVEAFHTHSELDPETETLITGSIQISGEWKGLIVLYLHPVLGDEFAKKMFSLEQGQISEDELRDAVGEIVNMVGGNLKSVLPQPSYLGLPIIALNGNKPQFPSTRECSRIVFECMGKNFAVTILQKKEKSSFKDKLSKS